MLGPVHPQDRREVVARAFTGRRRPQDSSFHLSAPILHAGRDQTNSQLASRRFSSKRRSVWVHQGLASQPELSNQRAPKNCCDSANAIAIGMGRVDPVEFANSERAEAGPASTSQLVPAKFSTMASPCPTSSNATPSRGPGGAGIGTRYRAIESSTSQRRASGVPDTTDAGRARPDSKRSSSARVAREKQSDLASRAGRSGRALAPQPRCRS